MENTILSRFRPWEFGIYGLMMLFMGGGETLIHGWGVINSGLIVVGMASLLYWVWPKIQNYRAQFTAF